MPGMNGDNCQCGALFAAGFAAGRRAAEQEVLDRIDRQLTAAAKKFDAEADKGKRMWLAASHSTLRILRARIAAGLSQP